MQDITEDNVAKEATRILVGSCLMTEKWYYFVWEF